MMTKLQLSKSLRAEKRAYRNNIIETLCKEILNAAKTSTNGRVPYGFVNKLVKQSSKEEPWINRNVINFAYRKFCQKVKSLEHNVEPEVTIKKITGRPKGSTNIWKHQLKEVVLAAKNEIAKFYLKEKDKYKKKGKSAVGPVVIPQLIK